MMKSNVGTAASVVLVLVAATSLLSMIGLTQIDAIVNRDLYKYGLHFSYEWAMPYWTMTAIVFGMGWFNIIVAIAFQLYILLSRRGEAQVPTVQAEASKLEAPSIPQPTEGKQPEIEKVEEAEKPKETPQPVEGEQAEIEKAEEAEKPKETPTPTVETEQKPEEKKEETPKTVEDTAQREPSETKPPEEEQKEQEAKPPEGAEPKPEETPTSTVETQPETQEKSEETPILVGVPEAEI